MIEKLKGSNAKGLDYLLQMQFCLLAVGSLFLLHSFELRKKCIRSKLQHWVASVNFLVCCTSVYAGGVCFYYYLFFHATLHFYDLQSQQQTDTCSFQPSRLV